jgi:hypothetical protein
LLLTFLRTVLPEAVVLRPESLLEVDLLGGTTEACSVDLDFYVSFRALYAIVHSEDELRVEFRDSRVGENRMFCGPDYGRLRRVTCMALFVLVPLVGCSGMAGIGGQGDTTAAPPGRILDPIAAFAADPPPSGQGQVFLPERNEAVTLRFVRQYSAASGRECREVRVAQRGGDNQRLFCRAGPGWIEARPLLAETVGR